MLYLRIKGYQLSCGASESTYNQFVPFRNLCAKKKGKAEIEAITARGRLHINVLRRWPQKAEITAAFCDGFNFLSVLYCTESVQLIRKFARQRFDKLLLLSAVLVQLSLNNLFPLIFVNFPRIN